MALSVDASCNLRVQVPSSTASDILQQMYLNRCTEPFGPFLHDLLVLERPLLHRRLGGFK